MNKDNFNTFNTFLGILNYYLNKPKNYIDNIDNATPDEKEKIKTLNKETITNSFVNNEYKPLKKAFIAHLYRGHSDMQYGIYFSMMYAKNDDDLKSKTSCC